MDSYYNSVVSRFRIGDETYVTLLLATLSRSLAMSFRRFTGIIFICIISKNSAINERVLDEAIEELALIVVRIGKGENCKKLAAFNFGTQSKK